MLAVVIVLWVLSSFLISMIFENDIYRKPFFITYFNTAAFMLYLLPTSKSILRNYLTYGHWDVERELRREQEGEESREEQEPVRSPLIPKDGEEDAKKRLSLSETIWLSAEFSIMWFSANFASNASLMFTSVASQTILSSTSSFFTLFVGALFHVESVNRVKVLGSAVSFLGIMLVTGSDSTQTFRAGASPQGFKTLVGNLLALAGALLYGLYSTLLKRKVKDESRINMTMFLGFVGFFTLVLLWPAMILLHYTGWETFELPTSPRVIIIVLSNCLITFISDYCWASAMLLTSPLTVTVGLSITIPLAMFGDFIFKHKPITFLYFVGAMFILGSFFIINRNSEEEHLEEYLERNEHDIASDDIIA
ncbi:related to integral membrane protein [Zygosaccharomyces bailii ISA1307]|nr:related to integral membrane protein [Zygosaccharomyces bailii ISA1307]